MFLFSLYIPDSSNPLDHKNGYDDCAVCRAWTKKQAIRKFKKMYDGFDGSAVKKVTYNFCGIAVLSDY